ncbi:MAG: formate--tetrahydrofolate ligase [Candidatus Omnitrophica bacterium]|nr:formate--tetrahydrofolate ligase [Candidatus Omnitrophota bacterium]
MPSNVEIASRARLLQIREIARKIGIREDELTFYGDHVAKVSLDILKRIGGRPNGKLINITSITPTQAGEGKTCTAIGLTQGLGRLKRKVMLCLREPSLGPLFGIKGGGTGGGYAQVMPMEEINMHFTGDIHAVSASHNLLAAMMDNHIFNGNTLGIDPTRILWSRAIDMNDRQLRHIILGAGKGSGFERRDRFVITAASEVMAILALASDISDLKERLGNIVVGYNKKGEYVTARQLKAVGAMAALLKHAIRPNLVQTIEGQPVFVHTGPFANISHGNPSIISMKIALKLADYVIVESGFGSDLGAEKFCNIVSREGGFTPHLVVLVVSTRALKLHGGATLDDMERPNREFLRKGFPNLERHLANIEKFGLECVVAINRFPHDTEEEITAIARHCKDLNKAVAVSDVVAKGGLGARELAEMVLKRSVEEQGAFRPLYDLGIPLKEKILTIASQMYGARDVVYTPQAEADIKGLTKFGLAGLPVNIAKTQLSFTDDPQQKGAPTDWTLTIRELHLSRGAHFIVAIAGNMRLMPGLSKRPVAESVDISEQGVISGLF